MTCSDFSHCMRENGVRASYELKNKTAVLQFANCKSVVDGGFNHTTSGGRAMHVCGVSIAADLVKLCMCSLCSAS